MRRLLYAFAGVTAGATLYTAFTEADLIRATVLVFTGWAITTLALLLADRAYRANQ